jgi:dienelactone hydrolase
MTNFSTHLGVYSDLVTKALRQGELWPAAIPGEQTRQRLREVVGFVHDPPVPLDQRVDDAWEADGVYGEAVSWSAGYGPRTTAVVVRPLAACGPLPGVVALHSHDDFMFFGKEKIIDGREPPPAEVVPLRDEVYGGRAFATELARYGFVVLAHDGFLWGSRRFPFASLPAQVRGAADRIAGPDATEIEISNIAGTLYEDTVERYCVVLGTSIAGVAAYEDRVATNYLRSRHDVLPDRVGCIGLSGGGCRAALLLATCAEIHAAVIVGMMSTYEALLDRHVAPHTWMLFPAGLPRMADWPDVAACRAPSPLLVQYCRGDQLFPLDGMKAADKKIRHQYAAAGCSDAYTGVFYDGLHRFDVEMQQLAFEWLKCRLAENVRW